jgi:hypothetical protein
MTQNDSPKVMFVISNSLSPEATKNEPIAWAVGQPHPILPGMSVIGMFVVPGEGVEIYAASAARKGVRSFIPMHWIRYVHEEMPFETFSEEFEAAVAGVDDEDDDGDFEDVPEETTPTRPPPPPDGPNGQPVP